MDHPRKLRLLVGTVPLPIDVGDFLVNGSELISNGYRRVR